MIKASPASEAAAVYVDPSTLTPWSQNPRNNEEAIAKVARSIERFGFASPIVARAADGRIIAGHTRHSAALSLGLRDVPVRFLDIDEQTASALALADNRLGEVAVWDEDGLAAILEGLAAEDVDLDGLGWGEFELSEIFGPNDMAHTTDGKTPEEKLEGYLDAKICRITLSYDRESYREVVSMLESAILNGPSEDNSGAVKLLLERECGK